MEQLFIKSIKTTRVRILNLEELDVPRIKVTINSNTNKVNNDSKNSYFTGHYNALLEKEEETDESRTFFVDYEIYVEFTCSDPKATSETIVRLTTAEIYPHLRAGVASVMAAASIQPLILPPIIE